MNYQQIILNFMYKFFCILKAASDGWIIKYIGGNKFEFISYKKQNINTVLNQYIKTRPSILNNIT